MATKSGAGGLVYSVVAIAIIVLIVSTVAVPVVNDANKSLETEMENSDARYSMAAANQRYVFDYVDGVSRINGIPVTDYLPQIANLNYYFAFSDKFILTVNVSDGTAARWAIFSPFLSTSNHFLSSDTAIITIDGLTFSIVDDVNSISLIDVIQYALICNPVGDYSAFSLNQLPKFADNGSRLYVVAVAVGARNAVVLDGGLSGLSSEFVISSGSLTDPMTATVSFEPTDDGASNTLNNLSFSTALSGNYFVFMPNTYHVITSNDSMLINLIGLIPVLLFLVPVMFAVRMIQTRRN